MLAADDVISVGRFLSAYSTSDVQNNELRVTYTVFNQQASEVSGTLLTTTLESGVTFKSASQTPSQNGQELAWSLGTIAPFGRASVEMNVSFAGPIPLVLDNGAEAFGTVDARAVTDDAPTSRLRSTPIDAALLASTPDANTTDAFVQAKAAQLDHDPNQIFQYLTQEVGYESYIGSLRGARGTLWSSAGNSLDEASLGIALLRASGIPARYAEGALPTDQAQQVLLSMFPDPLRILGCLDPTVVLGEASSDPELLAETEDHFWIQLDSGNGFQAADTIVPGAILGQTFSTAFRTFAEVPQELRHTTTVRLERELTTPGLLGTFQDVATVLEHEFNTVELVGRPITVGHFTSTSSFGFIFTSTTNTYSPYLNVGETRANPIRDEIIRGQDYQEVLTNFPFGSQLLTGVFLEVDVRAPDGSIQSFQKTIADRIGLATRRNGGSGGVVLGPDASALLSPLDLTTISVMPSRHSPAALDAADLQLDALQERYVNFLTTLGATPEGPERDALLPEGIALSNAVFIAAARARLTEFENISDQFTENLANLMLVKAYWDSPRITVFSSHAETQAGDTVAFRFSLDLRKDDIRAIPLPGQAAAAEVGFHITRGVVENSVETTVMAVPPEFAGDEFIVAASTTQIMAAADAAGIAIVVLSATNRGQLQELDISAEAMIRIGDALDANKLVIVPVEAVVIDGVPQIGWYEQDLDTGYTVGVLEDGSHGAMVEYFGVEVNVAVRSQTDQFFFGVLAGLGANSLARVAVFLFGVGVNAGQNDLQSQFTNAKQAVKLFIDFLKSEITKQLIGKPPLFVAGFAVGFTANIVFAADPPVGTSLFGSEPSDAFASLTGTNLAAGIIPDPLFSVPFSGALVPTVFRAGIKNLTSTMETFAFDFSSVPAGFSAHTSVSQLTVPAGQTGEISICLRPTTGLPAAGAPASFTLAVTSPTNPSLAVAETEAFTVPAIHGVTLSTELAELSTTPGAAVGTALTVQSVGNVPENVRFEVKLPSGVVFNGIGDVSLGVGQSATRTLTFTPAVGTPLNSTLNVTIIAQFDGIEPQEVLIPIHVVAPGVESIAQAATSARNALGNLNLANRLDDLGIALTNLTLQPGSEIFKSQAVAALDAVIGLMQVDEVLVSFAPGLTGPRDALAAAVTPAEVLTALTDVGEALDGFGEAVQALANSNFELFLFPNSQVALAGTPAQFELRLHSIGLATSTYNLTLGSLPVGVTGSISNPSVTLDRDGFAPGLIVTLTPPANEVFPFEFQVNVAVDGTPQIVKSAVGTLTVRSEFLSVVEVDANPSFVDPGTPVAVSARLLNSVNRRQNIRVTYTVENSSGQEVFTPPPINSSLDVNVTLFTLTLADFPTTGLPVGQYTINVRVTDENNNPLPGGTGTGTIFIGSPVTATLTSTPLEAPPGTSTIATTLKIDSQVTFNPAMSVIGQAPVAGATDVIRNSNLLYVAGSGGISIFNVADPATPTLIRSVGSAAEVIRIRGDKLVALRQAAGANSSVGLFIYSLADPQNPVLLGSLNDIRYNFIHDLVLTDTHAYIVQLQLCYFLGNGDIFEQNGDILAVNLTNPVAPVLEKVLFNHNGTNIDGLGAVGGCDPSGGDSFVWSAVQANSNTLLISGSTSAGTDLQSGVGLVQAVSIDPADPNWMTVVGSVQIPGTNQVLGIALDGDRALLTADSGNFKDPGTDFSFTGNGILATLDITNPRAPQLIDTQFFSAPTRLPGRIASIGNGLFTFGSHTGTGTEPQLHLADVNNPTNVVVSGINIPATVHPRLAADSQFIYTVSTSGLIIYQINDSPGVPVKASVQIPKNTGVSIVPGSFNQPPSAIVPGPNFDTLVWDATLASGQTTQTFTWQSTVNLLQPGEGREVTLDSTIDFTIDGTVDQLALPPQVVAGKQILNMNPGEVTVAAGQRGSFSIGLSNPTSVGVTYDLAVEGVPEEWVTLSRTQVFVPPNSFESVILSLQSDPFAPASRNDFVVTATTGGVRGSVQGTLRLVGDFLPPADPESHGVVAALIPTTATAGQGTAANYVVRVTNTGSATDTFELAISGLQVGVLATLEQDLVEVPPGVGNFRDVSLTIVPAAGTTADDYPFSVLVSSTTGADAEYEVEGSLTVVELGVDVDVLTASGPPSSTFQMLVRNTGTAAETFDLSLAGPAALVATLGTTAVTLAPGGQQTVTINIGEIDFAVPGAVQLVGIARARTMTTIADSDAALVTIAGTLGLTAAFDDPEIELPQPGLASFVLLVENIGNLEDQYRAEIVTTTGPVSASLTDLNGLATQSIPLFILPGLATGVLLLDVNLLAQGQGTVTVQVRSLTDDTIVAQATATVGEGEGEQAPVITSLGGGQTASVSIPENTTSVADVDATGTGTLTYSISGGDDAAKFTINSGTGVLSFITAPNFESPTDVGGNNTYDVIVQVSDGSFTDTQTIAVSVTNANEPPAITSNGGDESAALSVIENTTQVTDVNATDPDAAANLSFRIAGGADAARFTINSSSGVLSFATPPNFESPTDNGGNNTYDVIVQVSDGSLIDAQTIAVSMTNVNEPPTITSNGGGESAILGVVENTTAVTDVNATDPDAAANLTFSIAGGADAARFMINSSTGVLSFGTPPNFESPTDVGGDNIYNVIVQVSDVSLTDQQTLTVTVTDINESNAFLTVGSDAAAKSTPLVKVFGTDGSLLEQFLAYAKNFRGGVRVAVGDVNGDGVADVVTAPGRGHAAQIKVFDGRTLIDGVRGNAAELVQFQIQANASSCKDGFYVAVGDVLGHGLNDIIVSPERGKTEVRVFQNLLNDPANPTPGDPFSNTPTRKFLPFGSSFIGGATVAAGDVDMSRGKQEVIVGSGSGMRAQVKAYNVVPATPVLVQMYLPFANSFRGGVFVAAGDVNGDGVAEVIAGAGRGGSSRVEIRNGATGSLLHNATPYTDSSRQAAVRVAAKDTNGDGRVDSIFVGHAADGKTKKIRRIDPLSAAAVDFLLQTDPGLGGGFHLG